MGIKNASISLRKTSIILLQTYALNNVCFIYLFLFLYWHVSYLIYLGWLKLFQGVRFALVDCDFFLGEGVILRGSMLP